jgi:hypothetical protein
VESVALFFFGVVTDAGSLHLKTQRARRGAQRTQRSSWQYTASENLGLPRIPGRRLCDWLGSLLFWSGNDSSLAPWRACRFEVGGLEAFGGLPETLEFVVAAGVFGEDVDHEVDIIEQNPLRLAIAFGVGGVESGFFQAEFDFVGDGLDLAGIGAAADDEVIGESSGAFFEFEDSEIFGFFVLASGDGFGDLAAGFVGSHERVAG